MIIHSAEFVTSATQPAQYPPATWPEIAFAGRSNVGKSSLINTLVNRKKLVKTSSTPGRTQLLNFFCINASIGFVDLPGYGYARVPAAVKRKWGRMIETFLVSRPCLKGIVVILDIRRMPDDKELQLLAWLDANGLTADKRLIVITKTDKLSRNKQKRQIDRIGAALGLTPQALIPFSAKTRTGRERVWTEITRLMGSAT